MANKVAIITGSAADDGIGFAIARSFALEGGAVVLVDISDEVLSRATELSKLDCQSFAKQLDITQEDAWQDICDSTVSRFDRIDVLVNNAGIIGRSPLDQMTLDLWNKVLANNLTSAFLGCRSVIGRMKRQGTDGSIVNICSTSGLVGVVQSGAYGTSKGGLRQLAKVAAIEGATYGIRCNTIFPGFIKTGILKKLGSQGNEQVQQAIATIPLGRGGVPADIAYATLYLASDESKFVTGAEIVVDGGATVQ